MVAFLLLSLLLALTLTSSIENSDLDLLEAGYASIFNILLEKNPKITFEEACAIVTDVAKDYYFLSLGPTILEIERLKRLIARDVRKGEDSLLVEL
jgi:hypothetical protein